MKAVILAGGKGTRLRPYTTTIPKPLMPVGDKAILEIVLAQMKKHGFTDITLANGTTAHTAGDQLVPMITFLSTLTDGADITINWMEVSGL